MDDIIEDLRRINIPCTSLRVDASSVDASSVNSTKKAIKKKESPFFQRKKIPVQKASTVRSARNVRNVRTPKRNTDKPDVSTCEQTVNTQTITAPTIEDFAAKVLPPMKVVLTDGKIENINSGIKIECARGHIFIQSLLEIGEKPIKCPTCSQPGAITRKIREQIEDIFGAPFCLVKKYKTYIHYICSVGGIVDGSVDGSVNINLITVKSGHSVENPQGLIIVLPESQSRILINESIYKQCADWDVKPAIRDKIKALLPKEPVVATSFLPYSQDFTNGFPACRIIPGTALYIENCGFAAKKCKKK